MKTMASRIEEHPDRDLERRVVSYLAERHWPGLRHLKVEARSGTVTLRGTVNSFYEKQLSQQCCRRVAGVLKLIDAVDVATVNMPSSRAPQPAVA